MISFGLILSVLMRVAAGNLCMSLHAWKQYKPLMSRLFMLQKITSHHYWLYYLNNVFP